MRVAHASSSALRALTTSSSAAAASSSSACLLARRSYTPSLALCNSPPGRAPPPHLALPASYLLDGGNARRGGQRQRPAANDELLLAPPDALQPLRSPDDVPHGARSRSRVKAQPVARNLINEASLTAETLAELSSRAAAGGPLKNGLIPRTLLVCPVVPPEGRPGPPTLAGDLASRPDVRALVEAETHDLVLVKVGKVLQAKSSSADVSPAELSIVRLVERSTTPSVDPSSAAGKTKAKETRAQSALGKTSNLRNDGVPQELLVSWVSSANDLAHKLAQAREFLASAHRIKLTFQPKRKGGKRDPVPPPDVQREILDDAAGKLADIAERSGEDRFDKGKNAAYLLRPPSVQCRVLFGCCLDGRLTPSFPSSSTPPPPPPPDRFLEPTPKVRAAYRRLAEEKDATEASARAADQQRKEDRRQRAEEKRKESERVRAQNQAFLSNL